MIMNYQLIIKSINNQLLIIYNQLYKVILQINYNLINFVLFISLYDSPNDLTRVLLSLLYATYCVYKKYITLVLVILLHYR